MNYTEPPWIAIRQRGKYEGNYNIGRKADYGKGPLLTFIIVMGPNDIVPPEYGAQAEGNAHLIAAAPDLYRELKRVEWVETDRWAEPKCPWCMSEKSVGHAPDCRRQAAIAKAEGDE